MEKTSNYYEALILTDWIKIQKPKKGIHPYKITVDDVTFMLDAEDIYKLAEKIKEMED